MEVQQINITQLLKDKSILKQEVYKVTQEKFAQFKDVVQEELEVLKKEINDERVRLKLENDSEFEVSAYVGSDVLVSNIHTNVFTFSRTNPIWRDSYIQEDVSRAYCGIIHVYDFMAESFLQKRMNDPGYLLARILINKEGHFLIEGQGEFAYLYRNIRANVFNEEAMKAVFQTAVKIAANFDLTTPPLHKVSIVDVRQIKSITSAQEIQAGQKLGFKY